MIQLSERKPGEYRKVFLCGRPKSAGKTTFALSRVAASETDTALVLQYDLGNLEPPSFVDRSRVWWHNYAPAQEKLPAIAPGQPLSDRWRPSTNVGEAILRDAEAVRDCYIRGGGLKLPGQDREIALPQILILDGLTEMPQVIVDWILGVNMKTDAGDFTNHFELWTRRKAVVRMALHWLIPLPCDVIAIAWESPEMKQVQGARGMESVPTGKILPDIGGVTLDNMVAGKYDAAIHCFARAEPAGVKYMVRCAPDGIREWIGIRGLYGLKPEIDVTIHPGQREECPWVRVFGKEPT